jgi:hypothetical protein
MGFRGTARQDHRFPSAFRSLKVLLRARVADEMVKREQQSVQEFVDIWYSENTGRNLQATKIHS